MGDTRRPDRPSVSVLSAPGRLKHSEKVVVLAPSVPNHPDLTRAVGRQVGFELSGRDLGGPGLRL